MTPSLAAAPGRQAVRSHPGGAWARAVLAVHRSQLPTGEIPSYLRAEDGELLYRCTVLPSALVHDTFGIFDPTAADYDRVAAARLPPALRERVLVTATVVRRGIRDFLAWQQENDGRWRFFGRGSGLPPDAATTACAATALLDGTPARPIPVAVPRKPKTRRWARTARALERHRAAAGRYATFVGDDGVRFGALGPRGERRGSFDRVVEAHVLRFLGSIGAETTGLRTRLRFELLHGDLRRGSADHPEPMVFLHALARAWRYGGLADGGQINSGVHDAVASRFRDRVGGPLARALAIHAVLDATPDGSRGPASDASLALATGLGRALRDQAGPGGVWPYQPYVAVGIGSAGLTTALAVTALARLAAATGVDLT